MEKYSGADERRIIDEYIQLAWNKMQPELEKIAEFSKKWLDQWQSFEVMKQAHPILGVPLEVHLLIYEYLSPIDAVCLSLVK